MLSGQTKDSISLNQNNKESDKKCLMINSTTVAVRVRVEEEVPAAAAAAVKAAVRVVEWARAAAVAGDREEAAAGPAEAVFALVAAMKNLIVGEPLATR